MKPLGRISQMVAVVALVGLLASPGGWLTAAEQAQKEKGERPLPTGKCDAEAAKLVGQKPVRVGKRIRAPKKLNNVYPKFPEKAEARVGSGVWIGEALIEADGRIRHIWPLREVEFRPAWPEFNQAIVDAIKQWVFEPTLVDGRAVPLCMTVTTNINWQ